MEQQRRMILFFVLSFSSMYLWINVGVPYIYPDFNKPPVQQVENEDGNKSDLSENEHGENQSDEKLTATDSKNEDGKTAVSDGNKDDSKAAKPEEKIAQYPKRMITLGESGSNPKHFMSVDLSSRGAVVTGSFTNR